jgi:cytochrome P450
MLELAREYGTAVRYHFAFGLYAYVLTHPDHYRHILQQHHRNYDKAHPTYDQVRIAVGNGLVTADGEQWRRHRRLVQPSFHQSMLDGLSQQMVARTKAMLDRWDGDGGDSGRHELEIDVEMTLLTLGIVGEALLGTDVLRHAGVVRRAFSAFSTDLLSVATRPVALLTARWPILPSVRRMHAAAARLRMVADAIIDERASRLADATEPTDLLGVLLRTASGDDGARLSHDEVRDEVSTLMLAGHETSATTLTWTFCLLAEHPDKEARLVAELDEVLAGRPVTNSDLPRLVYTRAVAREAMRLFPPIWALGRRAIASDTVADVDLPAGAIIALSPYVTHRLPEFWESPEAFVPERFLPDAAPTPAFAYLPFSAGPRGCIGERFAMTEIVVVLATVLQRYRLRPVREGPVEAVPVLTLRPASPVRMLAGRVS